MQLPENVVAISNVEEAARDATLLIFVLPHQVRFCCMEKLTRQFILNVCKSLKGNISPKAHAISMIKGVDVRDNKISIFADVIQEALGIPCAALSGANIANEGTLLIFAHSSRSRQVLGDHRRLPPQPARACPVLRQAL